MATKTKSKGAAAKTPKAQQKPPEERNLDKPETEFAKVETLPVEQRGFTRIAETNRQLAEKSNKEVLKAMKAEQRGEPPPKPQKATGPMKRFVLLAGTHTDNDGRKYEYTRDAETIVEDTADLDTIFMNKFRRLEGDTNPGRDFSPPYDRAGLADAPMAERLPHGQQTQFSVDTDQAAQEKLRQTRESPQAQRQRTAKAEEEEPAADVEEDEEEEDSLGDDVTKDFSSASEADLMVFKDGKRFYVAESDAPTKAIHSKEFTSKKEVNDFLRKQIRE